MGSKIDRQWIDERVRRYKDLHFGADQYLDTKIEGHSRSQANLWATSQGWSPATRTTRGGYPTTPSSGR